MSSDFPLYALSEEHQAIREAVRAVCDAKVAPYAAWGNSPVSSTAAAAGATLASHTARTASRIAWCSSDRAYIGYSLMRRILLASSRPGPVE